MSKKLDDLIKKSVVWLPISACYECRQKDYYEDRCNLTERKNNRLPPEGIPKWCPLPKKGRMEEEGK